MSKGLIIGAVAVVLALLVLVYLSSASTRRLRDEGAFGSPIQTD
ncbi:MAG: hypothetical protein ABSE66_09670 [Thermoplasmata archaeon]|jgi:hypothetical protein